MTDGQINTDAIYSLHVIITPKKDFLKSITFACFFNLDMVIYVVSFSVVYM